MPLVTVIMPVYNYAHFMDDAAESLVSQSEKNWECWIIDDGSTDATASVSEKWLKRDSRFHYFFQNHRGLSAARNAGIAKAEGDFIQFLDADDRLENNKLLAQSVFLKEHPQTDLVYGETLYVGGPSREKNGMLSPNNLESLVNGNVTAVNAFLIRRSIFESVGFFDETLLSYEDWDLWLRCALKGKIFSAAPSLPDSRALVRIHSGSMIQNRKRMLESLLQVRRKIAGLLPDTSLKKLNQKLLTYDEGRLAFSCLHEGISAGRLMKITLALFAMITRNPVFSPIKK